MQTLPLPYLDRQSPFTARDLCSGDFRGRSWMPHPANTRPSQTQRRKDRIACLHTSQTWTQHHGDDLRVRDSETASFEQLRKPDQLGEDGVAPPLDQSKSASPPFFARRWFGNRTAYRSASPANWAFLPGSFAHGTSVVRSLATMQLSLLAYLATPGHYFCETDIRVRGGKRGGGVGSISGDPIGTRKLRLLSPRPASSLPGATESPLWPSSLAALAPARPALWPWP